MSASPLSETDFKKSIHNKPAFDNISEEKRNRIIQAATKEFASQGFAAANINVIAKNADISIGSMYNYFESKEALFLTINDLGYAIIEGVIASVNLDDGTIFDKFERLLRAVQKYSRLHPELNQIYLDVTSQGLSHLSRQLSKKMESITALFYRKLIESAQKDGTVDPKLDPFVTAFCLDNLLVMLQYAYASDYFSERMKIFAGDDALTNDEKIIQGIMRFIKGALTT